MEGIFFRKLFTLKLRTHNPFYLVLLLILSASFLALSLPFLYETLFRLSGGANVKIALICILTLPFSVGVFSLLNLIINLIIIFRGKKQLSDVAKRKHIDDQ